eukprot:124847_1
MHQKQQDEGIKLILMIMQNILANPTNIKYRDLNYRRIMNRLSNCSTCIDILFNIGFYKIKQRLILDQTSINSMKKHYKLLFDIKNDNIVSQLVDLGYGTYNECAEARNNVEDTNNVHEIIKHLSQAQQLCKQYNSNINCNKRARMCMGCQSLIEILHKYNDVIEDTDEKDSLSTHTNIDILPVLNNFHHFLHYHNNDEDTEYMNLRLKQHDFDKCEAITRHYKDRELDDNNVSSTVQLLDKLHCHFAHCYEIGLKLTNRERDTLNTYNIEHKNSDDCQEMDEHIMNLKNILNKKQSYVNKTFNVNCTKNKYCTNLGKSSVKPNIYSYSFRFYYWSYFKYLNKSHRDNNGYTFAELSIPQKYSNLKQELTQNAIASISMIQYKKTYNTAKSNIQTDVYKQIKCKINELSMDILQNTPFHLSNYGIKNNAAITVSHLLSVVVYCSYDKLQRTFSETFRLRNSENLLSLKQRHANFYHFAKLLRECVELYGTRAIDGRIKNFYHGINQQMLFKSPTAFICGVLSTTSDFSVAINFCCGSGMIVELVPHYGLKYFDCCNLSPFPNECEFLFVGGLFQMNFINVIFVSPGYSFEKYITAIRMMETFFKGKYFDLDGTAYHKVKEKDYCLQVDLLQLPKATSEIQRLVFWLIQHELHRYKPKQYRKRPKLPTYIGNLLHYICINKEVITINVKSMNADIMEKVQDDAGYIGYKFLKDAFKPKNGIFQLDIIHLLFPNHKVIHLINVQYVRKILMEDILNYIGINKNLLFIAIFPSNSDSVPQLCVQFTEKLRKSCFVVARVSHEVFGDGLQMQNNAPQR